ncbi:MAG TPA: hypothetical protein VD835_07725 [Pyrinomonadaceae bacterium]|nr:hypothetical protein [Pyrinomonadaceae bacterium]
MKGQPHPNDKMIDAAMRLGAASALLAVAEEISRYCNAEGMRALARFAEIKGYKALGFDSFDEFLDKYPRVPMTRGQYYERKALLDKEGAATFDVLNALRIPASARKQLTEGSARLDGDVIVIGESRVSVTDRGALLDAVKTLAARLKSQAETIELGRQDVQRLKMKLAAGSLPALLNSNPRDDAVNFALLAMKGLAEQARGLSGEQAAAARDNVVRQIGAAIDGVREVLYRE